jgi:hypothetical protein
MAAADAAVADRGKIQDVNTQEYSPEALLAGSDTARKDPLKDSVQISFHLRQLFGTDLPPELERIPSAKYLRIPFEDAGQHTDGYFSSMLFSTSRDNPAGVTMEVWVDKLKITKEMETLEWQTRLLIITTKRIFIIIQSNEDLLEIVDSIPLQEITSIQILSSGDSPQTPKGRQSLDSPDRSSARINQMPTVLGDDDNNSQIFEDRLDNLLSPSSYGDGQVLKVTTSPGGFNGGQPFYFTRARDIRRPTCAASAEEWRGRSAVPSSRPNRGC